jgi:hypothetical protein
MFCVLHKIGLSPIPCRSFLPPVLQRKPTRATLGSLWRKLPVTAYIGDGGLHKAFVRAGKTLDVPSSGVPEWFALFDWVVGTHFGFTKKLLHPRSVWVHGANFSHFARWIDREVSRDRVHIAAEAFLVVGGIDQQPSQYDPKDVDTLKRVFPRVFFEANDGLDPGLSTYPTAVSHTYFRGYEDVIEGLLWEAPAKEKLLLASWGLKWPSLNMRLADRANALVFLDNSSFATLEVLPTGDYLRKLASSHYMMYPRGQAIQSPKGFEAWLFKTIPVVTSHPVFHDLKHRGVPLLIVETWSELTEDLLHKELPRLKEEMEIFHPLTLDAKKWWDFGFGQGKFVPSVQGGNRNGLS